MMGREQHHAYLMDVICFTTSWGECRSIRRLWILHSRELSSLFWKSLCYQTGFGLPKDWSLTAFQIGPKCWYPHHKATCVW